MKWFLLVLLCSKLFAEKEMAGPIVIEAESLVEYEELPEVRKNLITTALTEAKKSLHLRYHFGGSKPEQGGFDCSGAMYFTLRKEGLTPPRTSAQQFLWVRDAKKLTKVPRDVRKVDHEVFKTLQPGDLLFWSGTYQPTDGREIKITHVGMYLGTEKKDGRPVMICATRGRSYRGVQRDGFGVYDFKLPSAKSRSQFEGYGPPLFPKKKGGESE